MTTATSSSRVLRIVGAFAAVGGAVLWLAFFVEHVTAWFIGPPWPPPEVWIALFAHLAIFVGLVASLRWRLAGSVATIVSTIFFFAMTVWPPVPVLFIPAIAPALIFLAAWALGRHADAQRLRA